MTLISFERSWLSTTRSTSALKMDFYTQITLSAKTSYSQTPYSVSISGEEGGMVSKGLDPS